MPLLAILDEAAFGALADETVLGKDSYVKDEKTNTYKLALDGEEAGKLALPLQQSVKNLETNNKKLLDEKVETLKKLEPFTKLGKTAEEIDAILKEGKTPDIKRVEEDFKAKLESLEREKASAIDGIKAELEAAKTQAVKTEETLQNTVKRQIIADLKNSFDMDPIAEDWLSNRIEVVKDETSGKYTPRVIENGEPAYKAGAFKTPAQLVEEARANKDLSGLFKGGTGSGTGAPPRQGQGFQGGVIRVSASDSKNNPSLYENAKAEAAKTGAQIVFTE